MYEGAPDTPREQDRSGDDRASWSKGRLSDIITRYGVTHVLHRAHRHPHLHEMGRRGRAGQAFDLLVAKRVLGTVGEPINPEAWMWYHEHIGNGGAVPDHVDTWWQTETGGHHDHPASRGHHDQAWLGDLSWHSRRVRPSLIDDAAQPASPVGGGYLTLAPSMARRCCAASGATPTASRTPTGRTFPGRYFAGDGAKLDDDGYLWLLGRVDDVMNVSGHRISTTEIESALVDHPAVAEAAVVGANDDTTGQAVFAYVILRGGAETDEAELRAHVTGEIGAIARPKRVFITPDLPKTRSGKIMRRLLRDVAEGRNIGDTTTLADASIVDELQAKASESNDG